MCAQKHKHVFVYLCNTEMLLCLTSLNMPSWSPQSVIKFWGRNGLEGKNHDQKLMWSHNHRSTNLSRDPKCWKTGKTNGVVILPIFWNIICWWTKFKAKYNTLEGFSNKNFLQTLFFYYTSHYWYINSLNLGLLMQHICKILFYCSISTYRNTSFIS